MDEIDYDEWMSDSDAVLWYIERDPLLRSTITSVWMLEALPDAAHMDAVAARVVDRLPRMRQRVIDDLPTLTTPRWEDDPNFDLDHHYRRVRLPGRSPGLDQVLTFAQREAAGGFDRARPLWELSIVEGLAAKRAAVVLKVHHAIADGLGLVQMLSHMVELAPGASIDPPAVRTGDTSLPDPFGAGPSVHTPAFRRSLSHRMSSETRTALRLGRAGLRATGDLARHPLAMVRQAGRTADSVARIVAPAPSPLSPLMTRRSMTVRLLTLRTSFDAMHASAKQIDGTLNDVFVAAVAEALDRYHRELGTPCAVVRMLMPVSVRSGDQAAHAGNQFVPTRLEMPLDATDPRDRLARTRQLLREVRAEPALPHVNDISGAIARFGPTVSVAVLGAMMKGVDVTTSNVPGPPFPVWIGGARIEEFYAFGPLAGSAINITLFSYDGTVHLGVSMDAAAVIEPERFLECLRLAVDVMTSFGSSGDR